MIDKREKGLGSNHGNGEDAILGVSEQNLTRVNRGFSISTEGTHWFVVLMSTP